MKLDLYYERLMTNKITTLEYIHFRKQSLRLVQKACRRYCLDEIVLNTAAKIEIYDNVYIKSLFKTMKSYDKTKSSFCTYFYYKALSAARVEAGKAVRRIKVLNTFPLIEEISEDTSAEED